MLQMISPAVVTADTPGKSATPGTSATDTLGTSATPGTSAMRVRDRQERSVKYGQEVIVNQPAAMSVCPDFALVLRKEIPKG